MQTLVHDPLSGSGSGYKIFVKLKDSLSLRDIRLRDIRLRDIS